MGRSSIQIVVAILAATASVLIVLPLAEQKMPAWLTHKAAVGMPHLKSPDHETSLQTQQAPFIVPAGYQWLEPQAAMKVVHDLWGEHFLPAPSHGLLVPMGVDLDSDEAWGLVVASPPNPIQVRLPTAAEFAPGTNVLGFALQPVLASESHGLSSRLAPGVQAEWAVELERHATRLLAYRAVVRTAEGPMLVAAHIPKGHLAEVRAVTLALAATAETTATESAPVKLGTLL